MENNSDHNQSSNNPNENPTNDKPQNEHEVEEESNNFNIVDKIIEMQNKLDKIISLKNEGNAFFKSSAFDDAIQKYSKANELIGETDELFLKYLQKSSEKDENLKNLNKSHIKEKVAIFSNLAMIYYRKENFELSVEHDLKIITGLDYYFDKSHIRLIQNYIKLEKFEYAVYHWNNMRKIFDNDTLEKHKEIFDKILKENNKFSDALNKYKNVAKGGKNNSSKYLMILGLIIFAGAWLYMRFIKTNNPQEETVAIN